MQSVNAPFLTKTEIILDATDVTELYKNVSENIMESMAAFQMRGSNMEVQEGCKARH